MTTNPLLTDEQIFSEIVIKNALREKYTLSRNACKSTSGFRLDPARELIPDRSNIRPIFSHDTDRIIHSKAYTRYIDKTQVFYCFKNDHITHRTLHVQFVSKIGRFLGKSLSLNEDLIEASALGHDLGHVPFGHDGERILNEICEQENIGGFHHNAQSVRVLHLLENGGEGLNLSLQVLDAILCHNGELVHECYKPNLKKSKEDFLCEYESLMKGEIPSLIPMTLEGCVVRISDILAYVGRDIEDAITLKLISRDDLPQSCVATLGNTNREIINTLVRDIIKNSYNKNYISMSGDVYQALQELKEFNYENIYFHPEVKSDDSKIKKMFFELYEFYKMRSEDKSSRFSKDFLSGMNSKYIQNNCPERKVIDYLAGMTDNYFIDQYKRHFMPKVFGVDAQDLRSI